MYPSLRVVVTGLGVVSSIGTGWREFWQALIEGRSGISPVEAFDTAEYVTHNGGEVKNFAFDSQSPARKTRQNRAAQLGLATARLALADSDLSPEELQKQNAGLCFGTTFGSIQMIEHVNDQLITGESPDAGLLTELPPHTASGLIARALQLQGPNSMITTACSAGNYALGHGYDLIRAGRTGILLCGASDPFSRIAFTGFNQFSAVAPEKCQPFDLNRKGMMVAEGAGVLVLERLDHALQRGATIYAEIGGYGLSCDAHHMTTPSTEGIAACMRNALSSAGIGIDDVDYISAHGTGTVANDKNECAAIRSVFDDRAESIPVSSIKSMLGHTMGAASALEAIACVLAVKYQMIPPTMNFETPDPECAVDCVPNKARAHPVRIALNNSYAFGGNNASLVIKKYTATEENEH